MKIEFDYTERWEGCDEIKNHNKKTITNCNYIYQLSYYLLLSRGKNISEGATAREIEAATK